MQDRNNNYRGPLLIADAAPEGVIVAKIDHQWAEKMKRQSDAAESFNKQLDNVVGEIHFSEFGRFVVFDINAWDIPEWHELSKGSSELIIENPSESLSRFFEDAENQNRILRTDLHRSVFLPGQGFEGEFQLKAFFKNTDEQISAGGFSVEKLFEALALNRISTTPSKPNGYGRQKRLVDKTAKRQAAEAKKARRVTAAPGM